MEVVFVGGVADDFDPAGGPDGCFMVGVAVEDDALFAEFLQSANDGLAEASEPDDDDVISEFFSHSFRPLVMHLGEGIA
jgi:hypothetical protein